MLFKDLTNQKFGQLTAIKAFKKPYNKNKYHWHCVCDCGRLVDVLSSNLTKGNSTSCGCTRNKKIGALNLSHGLSKTRMYKIWVGVRKRCLNSSAKSYERYGGRGIGMSKKWDTYLGFYNDMINGYSDDLTLERIDPNGNYEASNCRWANATEQARNKTNTKLIEYDGLKLTAKGWQEITGTLSDTIQWRIKKGWDLRKALYGEREEKLENISKYLVF